MYTLYTIIVILAVSIFIEVERPYMHMYIGYRPYRAKERRVRIPNWIGDNGLDHRTILEQLESDSMAVSNYQNGTPNRGPIHYLFSYQEEDFFEFSQTVTMIKRCQFFIMLLRIFVFGLPRF